MAITINGLGSIGGISEGGLTDGCVTTADIKDGAVGARPNHFINGACQIWQRGTGTFNTNNAVTADRIRIYNASVTRSTDAPDGFMYSIKNTTSSSGGWLFQGGIELDTQGDAGCYIGDMTFSFYGKFDSGDSVTVASWFADGSGGVNQSSSVWSTSVTGTGSWERYVVTVNSSVTPNASNKCLRWVIYDSQSQSWTTYAITGLKLELGDSATPFEHRTFDEELALCKRYYEKSFNYDTAPANGVYTQAHLANVPYADQWVLAAPCVQFEVEKRATPSITYYGSSGKWQVNNNSNGWDTFASIGSTYQGTSGIKTKAMSVSIHNNGNSGYTTGYAKAIRGDWTADAEL